MTVTILILAGALLVLWLTGVLGATHPYLGTLQYDSGGGSYVDVGQIVDFTPAKRSAGRTKTSHLGSTGATHTYIAGFIEPGEYTFIINMVAAQFNTLNGHITGRANRNYRVRYNDGSTPTSGSTFVTDGFLADLGDETVSRDSNNPIRTMGTIQSSGVATYSVAT